MYNFLHIESTKKHKRTAALLGSHNLIFKISLDGNPSSAAAFAFDMTQSLVLTERRHPVSRARLQTPSFL